MAGFAYHELGCFLAVAEHGHFGRAAAALQLSQPAVSKIVRRVELGVGAPLFQRGSHGVALTHSGQLFLEPARQLVRRHEETLRAASDIQAQHVGLLRLGFTQATSESRVTKAVADLIRRRPGLRVRLTVGKSDDLERAVLEGQLDLAVVPSYPGYHSRCARIVIGEDELTVAARPRHPLFQTALEEPLHLQHLQHLQRYSWALPGPGSAARKVVDEKFADQGFGTPTVVLEIQHNTDAVIDIVGQTDLLCFVPSHVLRNWPERLQPLPMSELRIRRQWLLISNPRASWSALMAALRDLVVV